MKHLVAGWVVAAGLYAGLAGAQAAPSVPDASPAVPARKADSPAKPGTPNGYRSPFADYRPFTSQEPLKSWRAANDAVREVGGHIGLMKGGRDGEAKASKGGKP